MIFSKNYPNHVIKKLRRFFFGIGKRGVVKILPRILELRSIINFTVIKVFSEVEAVIFAVGKKLGLLGFGKSVIENCGGN